MGILRVKTTECRVGVVGLYNAGKTVLLTSLINHLQDHDADRFPLGSPATRVRKFTVLPPDPGWEPFNYTGCRDALVHGGRWPAKTRDRAQYVCKFERSDWTFSDCLLKVYDLPGERIDVVTWVPFGQLADDAGKLFGSIPGISAVGGAINQATMMPFRTSGPLNNPSTKPDLELAGKGLLKSVSPERVLDILKDVVQPKK